MPRSFRLAQEEGAHTKRAYDEGESRNIPFLIGWADKPDLVCADRWQRTQADRLLQQ